MIWRSRVTRSGCLLLAFLAAGSGAARAQHRAGSIEAGAYVQINRFDNSVQLDNATGAGARVGVFLRPVLSLELTAAYAQTGDTSGLSVSYVPVSFFAMFHLPINDNLDVLLGPGYVHTTYGKNITASADGFSALVGLRFMMTPRVGIRADGRADFYSNSPIGSNRTTNYGVTVGVSFFLGKQARRDSDADGVDDALDRCGGTRAGTLVDATGCPVPMDSDLDGVLDPLDRCPDTPRGERIDPNGCPLDADNDGVFGDRDECLATPAGDTVDARGCTVIPDSDGDGVPDDSDQCPDTPAGTKVDSRGCTIDSDGDGVLGVTDRCPDTPPGTKVNDIGCALPAIPVFREAARFSLNSAVLSDSLRDVLRYLADSLAGYPDERYRVEGHADSTGPPEFNRVLSQDRADTVRTFLISVGMASYRLEAVGYGSDRPIASNDTPEGRARNRRVVLRRID